jgi:hypothetical protein
MCGPHKLKCSECAWYYKQRVIQGYGDCVFRIRLPVTSPLGHRTLTASAPHGLRAEAQMAGLDQHIYTGGLLLAAADQLWWHWAERTHGLCSLVRVCGTSTARALSSGGRILTSWRSQHLVTGIHDGIQWWVYDNYNSQCSNILYDYSWLNSHVPGHSCWPNRVSRTFGFTLLVWGYLNKTSYFAYNCYNGM